MLCALLRDDFNIVKGNAHLFQFLTKIYLKISQNWTKMCVYLCWLSLNIFWWIVHHTHTHSYLYIIYAYIHTHIHAIKKSHSLIKAIHTTSKRVEFILLILLINITNIFYSNYIYFFLYITSVHYIYIFIWIANQICMMCFVWNFRMSIYW